ncbi:MFS transporter [Peribacillus muralis]|uniref:MFS transporter n=1 Tax=Peribacillus muralis TaxID=264697 RepID=UPI003D00B44D
MNKIRNIKNTYYLINILYAMGIAVFGSTLYLYMETLGYNFSQINIFLAVFWVVGFFTEIPSGIIADSFGRKNTLIASCIVRSLGLFFLFIDWGNITFLILGAIFTSIGESLKSGTVDSWMIDSIQVVDEKYQFEKVFSFNQIVGTTFSLLSGYFGAQILGVMDLSYPVLAGVIILLITIIVVLFFMKEPRNEKATSEHKGVGAAFSSLKKTTGKGFTLFRTDKTFFLICISFLPLSLIVTGPFNQWQLFFQEGRESINTGYIYIGLSLFGMFGAFLSSKVSALSENKIYILIASTLINTAAVVVCVLIENYILAICLFFVHVTITATEEVIRFTFLNQNINKENRATLLSFFNTLEAGATILALLVNGLFSDLYGIGNAWLIMSAISIVVSIPVYLIVNNVLKKHLTVKEQQGQVAKS